MENKVENMDILILDNGEWWEEYDYTQKMEHYVWRMVDGVWRMNRSTEYDEWSIVCREQSMVYREWKTECEE